MGGYYRSEGNLGAAREIARQRAGRQRPGESDEAYGERVAEHMPRAHRPPVNGSEDVRSRIIEKRQREGIERASA
jgi:hypothetical protein